MTSSIIEITENEYLIKLNRNTFDLSLIRNILRMVEISNPTEDDFGMPERYCAEPLTNSAEPGYFGSIDEK